jgi:hypothetical protein
MFEKIAELISTYCFAVVDVYLAFLGRTHAGIALGIPVLFFIGVSIYLPGWVTAAIFVFVVWPAATALIVVVGTMYGLLLARSR